MHLPWKELGLSRFVVQDSSEKLLFVDGKTQLGKELDAAKGLVSIVYDEGETPRAINLRLLAKVFLPTLPDHSLSSLCAYYHIPLEQLHRKEAIGTLFAFLIEEGLRLNPEVISLLGHLLPPSTGELVRHLLPLAEAVETKTEEEPLRPTQAPVISTKEALSSNGVIAQQLPGFEIRPAQQKMASLVAQVFEQGGTLAAEAGAGTGKTFAYLVPALLHLRVDSEERLVISTRTKQLQEQLFLKDLPFLISQLNPQLKVALLKGRENYLCLRRFETMLVEVIEGLEQHVGPLFALLVNWRFQTGTGDIEENGAFLCDSGWRALWARLHDDPRHCPGPDCPFFGDCFSFAARRHAREADLVVVNHSLLLADLQAGGGILGGYKYLVVDEAHALERAVRQAFTTTLTWYTLDDLTARIERVKGRGSASFIHNLSLSKDDKRVVRLREFVSTLRAANTHLFSSLDTHFADEGRGRLPGMDEFRPLVKQVVSTIDRLKEVLEQIGEALADPEKKHEAEGLTLEAEADSSLFQTLFGPPKENHVHWYERRERGIALRDSPLEIAGFLQEPLYPRLAGLILTSATLSLEGRFSYLGKTLGLDAAPKDVNYALLESPCSDNGRMSIYFPEFLPPVDGLIENYADAISSLVSAIVATMKRKVLVLFTSYSLLRAVEQRISEAVVVLSQEPDAPRSKLLEQFRGIKGGAVLLGTDSFWEGVDLPGAELEILVITRLPFPVPTDPVFLAMTERLRERGEDPFINLAIPQALLKLRQGTGRLIRKRTDRGSVIITDSRVFRKRYGQFFAACLPISGKRVRTQDELLANLRSWFSCP